MTIIIVVIVIVNIISISVFIMITHWLEKAKDSGNSSAGNKKTTKALATVFLAFPVRGQTVLIIMIMIRID